MFLSHDMMFPSGSVTLGTGVEASKFLGLQGIFAQIFPNLPKSCAKFVDRFLA